MQEKEIVINYCPHPAQQKVHDSDARYKVLVCGRRWGKTTLAINTIVKEALCNKNGYYWLCSPTYRQSKMIAWRMLKNYIPTELSPKYNESELSVVFPNESIIELKGADNEDALRGVGLDGLVVDEFASIYNNWAVWNEVLRPALSDKKGWVLFIGTPKGKDSFFELFLRGQNKDNGWESWQFKTTDNPYIDPKEIEDARKNTPARYFRQEYEASFEDFTGLIYPEFNEKNHVIKPYYVPIIYKRIGSIDTAVTGTTGVLKAALDEDANLIVYSEYYEKNKRVSEVSQAIKEDNVKWIIDPESRRKQVRGEDLYSLFDEYKDNGIQADDAQKDVNAGINRVGEYLKQHRIKIFSSCTNLIYELERYHWAEVKETSKGDIKAEPFKSKNHLVDCLRYLIMSRPKETDITQPEYINVKSAWGQHILNERKAKEPVYGRR